MSSHYTGKSRTAMWKRLEDKKSTRYRALQLKKEGLTKKATKETLKNEEFRYISDVLADIPWK